MARNHIAFKVTSQTYIVLAFCVVLLPLKWMIAWLLAVALHEMGHVIACLLCGGRIQSVHIGVSGAKIEAVGLSYGKQLVASLAGPITGLFTVAFCKWIPMTAMLSTIHSAYNLFPLAGLDGYNALNYSVCLLGNPKRAYNFCRIADIISRIILVGIGTYVSFRLGWTLGIVLCVLLLVSLKRNSCKQSTLQVQ